MYISKIHPNFGNKCWVVFISFDVQLNFIQTLLLASLSIWTSLLYKYHIKVTRNEASEERRYFNFRCPVKLNGKSPLAN